MKKAHSLIRAHRIGSSDAAKILGLSKWGNAHDVYLRLTDRLEVEDVETPAMLLGKMMEAPLVKKCAKELKVKIKADQLCSLGNLCAQIDAMAVGFPIGIEAKTASDMDEWGADGTADIPAYYAAQTLHQAAVAGLDMVAVPAFFVGLNRAYRSYRLPYSTDDRVEYLAYMEKWYEKHIKGDTPPECAPSLAAAKLIKRVPGKVIVATQEQVALWNRWRKVKTLAEKLADEKDSAQARVYAAMGDAEVLEHEGRKLTAKWQDVKGYTVEVKAKRFQTLREGKVK